MCSVSMIMQVKTDEWQRRYFDQHPPSSPFVWPNPYYRLSMPTEDEIAEFRLLLERAREYDRKHNEPDCELQEKKDRLKTMAKELGVEIEFV